MFASHPSRTTVPWAPAFCRLAPIWAKEPSNAPAAYWANWPLLASGSSGRLTTSRGGRPLAGRRPEVCLTRAGKLAWPRKRVPASTGRPRRATRHLGSPEVPERQGRPERMGVFISARAGAAASAASSRPPAAEASRRVRAPTLDRSIVFDENCGIVISRRDLGYEPWRKDHGQNDLTAPGSPWPRTALDLAAIGARVDEGLVSIRGGARVRRTWGHAARRRSGPANRKSGISGGPLAGPARRPRGRSSPGRRPPGRSHERAGHRGRGGWSRSSRSPTGEPEL